MRAVARSMFYALKPGGALVIVDHVAASGSQLRDQVILKFRRPT